MAWADTMSTFVKSVDHKHLVGVGDEGFNATSPDSTDFLHNGSDGVDNLRLSALRNVDVMSFHLYPDGWKQSPTLDFGVSWITEHVRQAKRLHKPAFLGEFGLLDKATRNTVYKKWTDTFVTNGGTGELYWILSDTTDNGTLYGDYDGFTVYCPSPVCTTLSNAGALLRREARTFPPVADADTMTADFGQPATTVITANDIAYGKAKINTRSVDLDPVTPGRQSTLTVTAGTLSVADDGTLTYTPASGFVGRVSFDYTVADTRRRLSNVATVTVVAKPDPTAAIPLFSFEDGVQGWAEQSWATLGGTVTQTTAFATDGTHGVQIDSKNEWFGLDLATPIDLSTKSVLKADIATGAAGTSVSVVLKTGSGSLWCQGPFIYYGPGVKDTVSADMLTGLSCDGGAPPDLTQVRGVYLFFNAGSFLLDNIRAE